MKTIDKMTAEEIYLDYLNDFLTVSAMADYYNVTIEEIATKIKQGRKDHYNL